MNAQSCWNESNDKRFAIIKYLYAVLHLIILCSAQVALADQLPSHCRQDPDLARQLSRMGPVMGMGSSVSHGLMARSASEIVAEQLCLGNEGHVFPWYFPGSWARAAKFYYSHRQPRLVLALDITYHDMKVLEYTSDKRKVLDRLVTALAHDCESRFYDCSESGDVPRANQEGYRPTVLLGDLFFENLIDCRQGPPPKPYRIENTKPRPKKLCFEEYDRLNRHLRNLAAQYPNVHLFPANRLFTSFVKYPHSIFYNEGRRQTFFARDQLTWDGWHPYTDPGSYVFANLIIMHLNRLIAEGKIKGRRIPLKKLADKYFGPPSGLILLVPAEFPALTRPRIVGPDGQPVPLRFSLSEQWAERHGVFEIGTSYFKGLALSWDVLGPKPLVLRAQSFSGTTIVLSKEDRDRLGAYYRSGTALKGALLLMGEDLGSATVSREDTFFLNQLGRDKSVLRNRPRPPVAGNAAGWDYHTLFADD